ncbi:protein kinase, ATP binding site-containing protein, partial [Tanacetum coccineum]
MGRREYVIPLEEINLATRNFNKETIVTRARWGMVYQGQLSGLWGNQTATFKRFDRRYVYAEYEFRYELRMISNFNHENIIGLIGYCDEGNEMILAYKYAINGSLDLHLQDENKRRCLRWEQRLKICIGVVRGLNYLRSDHGEDNILVHRNLMCQNILLDDTMEPLITGLSASKVIEINQHQFFDFPSTSIHYHLDPIYRGSGIVKAEADIYSLGVILFDNKVVKLPPLWLLTQHVNQ